MSKPTIIPNWHYQKPTSGGYRGLKKLLKYTSYRESPDHHPIDPSERWTDCGLGKNWREVYDNASRLAGPYVLAHHLVIAPAPDLMALVPENQRHAVVREITERTIEAWHEARGLDLPEYAYVLHDRDTDDDKQLQNLHTHVFIAGTIPNSIGERESHRVRREQVVADVRSLERDDNLHHIARLEFEALLDRTLEFDWRRVRERELEREQPRHDFDIPFGPRLEIDL